MRAKEGRELKRKEPRNKSVKGHKGAHMFHWMDLITIVKSYASLSLLITCVSENLIKSQQKAPPNQKKCSISLFMTIWSIYKFNSFSHIVSANLKFYGIKCWLFYVPKVSTSTLKLISTQVKTIRCGNTANNSMKTNAILIQLISLALLSLNSHSAAWPAIPLISAFLALLHVLWLQNSWKIHMLSANRKRKQKKKTTNKSKHNIEQGKRWVETYVSYIGLSGIVAARAHDMNRKISVHFRTAHRVTHICSAAWSKHKHAHTLSFALLAARKESRTYVKQSDWRRERRDKMSKELKRKEKVVATPWTQVTFSLYKVLQTIGYTKWFSRSGLRARFSNVSYQMSRNKAHTNNILTSAFIIYEWNIKEFVVQIKERANRYKQNIFENPIELDE